MAYDEGLAERIRGVLDERADVTEKRMFGGIAFLVRGHMCVGIVKKDLMVRVGPDAHAALVREPHARPMDFTGRPMNGFLYVAADGLEADADLERWVGHGLRQATSLAAKGKRASLAPERPSPKLAAARSRPARPRSSRRSPASGRKR